MLLTMRKIQNKLLKKTISSNNPVLQEYFFRLALCEIGVWGGKIKIDHTNGKCYHKSTGWIPIIFPQALLSMTSALSKKKSCDYFFRGMIYPGREWVENYTGDIARSDRGRDINKKYNFDLEYYRSMSTSLFCLSPVGDCPWSYRFFEAIMCFSTPIIGESDHDIFSKDYYFLRHNEPHHYKEERMEANYSTLIRQHTLRGLGF